MQGKVLGFERRRRWGAEAKTHIIGETLLPGTVVSEVARRHRVSQSLLFTWGRQARVEAPGVGDSSILLPVEIEPPVAPASNEGAESLGPASRKPSGLGLAGAEVQSRQCRFVGEDALALADARKNESRERFKVEADRAHPSRHQRAADFDAVAGVDGLLAVERQAVGVFGDGDLRQQRLGRQAGLGGTLGRRRLQDRRWLLEQVFLSDRHDEPEARPHDVMPEALVLADLDPLLVLEARRDGGFDNLLDMPQMPGKARLGR